MRDYKTVPIVFSSACLLVHSIPFVPLCVLCYYGLTCSHYWAYFRLFAFSTNFRGWMFSNVGTLVLMFRANGFEVAARVLPMRPDGVRLGVSPEALFCRS